MNKRKPQNIPKKSSIDYSVSRIENNINSNRDTRKNKRKIGVRWVEFELKPFFKKLTKHHRKAIIWGGIIALIIILLIPPVTYLYFASDLKDKETIINRGKTGLTLKTRESETFFTFYQPKEISYIPLSEIPESVQEAAIATEDKTFYTNPGFSIRGVARAFINNLLARKIVEGGSTITQELAKNAFLSSRRSFLRKYQELVLAAELNRRFSKQDILEMYLNSVYFGEGAFGIENAALAYFGKSASELTLSESALLIGILPAPSVYSPLSNDDTSALIRQEIVLSEMVEEEFITKEEKEIALSENLGYKSTNLDTGNILAPHFALFVKDQLINKYGEERVTRDGFIVTTTLNKDYQEFAESVVKNQILNLKSRNASNAAAVALDPETSEILAMIGSYDWYDEEYGKTNMSIRPRQPGSSFKPLIYAEALEKKMITAADILDDSEKTFEGNYKPQNYDERFRGPVTVRRALANSLNIPAVEVMEKVGIKNALNRASDMGITTLSDKTSDYGLSLVLGSGEVPLLDLTNAYAVFANEGIRNTPKYIIEIKDKYGNTVDERNWITKLFPIFDDENRSEKALSEETSFIISNILADNNARSETFGGSLTINHSAAVKTGTTEDYRDALTVGYAPNLVIGVWVGNNDNSPMDEVAGSQGAAPIWRLLMNNFLQKLKNEEFNKPTFVVAQLVCIPGYKNYTEYFISGTQPASCEQPTPTPTINISPSPSPTPDEEPTEEPDPTPTAIPTQSPTPTNPTPTSTQFIQIPTPTIFLQN
jgi:1A family penicillin-binding protein